MKNFVVFLLVSLISINYVYSKNSTFDSIFGICAHLATIDNDEHLRTAIKSIKDAGYKWIRCDFEWSGIQKNQNGEWNFEHLDRLVRIANEEQVYIYPILDYAVDWATPVYDNIELWLEYVHKVVSRYQADIKIWQVWNEPDCMPFWYQDPKSNQYLELLKHTYLLIKNINPELKVALGGIDPRKPYIRELYEQGAKNFFDIMDIHFYTTPYDPLEAGFPQEIINLRNLMEEFGDNKDIWISEAGYPTQKSIMLSEEGGVVSDVFRLGLKYSRPDKDFFTLAVLENHKKSLTKLLSNEVYKQMIPGESEIIKVKAENLKYLEVIPDAILVSLEEDYRACVEEILYEYVKEGGILLTGQGVPFFYRIFQDASGVYNKECVDNKTFNSFHMNVTGNWSDQTVPQTVNGLIVQPPFHDFMNIPEEFPSTMIEYRYLKREYLSGNDQFVPILSTYSIDGKTGNVAGIYKLDSDLKGAIIASGVAFTDFKTSTEDRQKTMLKKYYKVAYEMGIKKLFWYNFRAQENTTYYCEDHFGIVHKDLTPKPAYFGLLELQNVIE